MDKKEERLPDDVLWHQSGINAQGEPFVQSIRGMQVICQMSPQQARDHAQAILEAAEAAEQDAFIFDWTINHVGGGKAQAAGLIADFRAYREKRTGKKGGPSNPNDWVMPPPDKTRRYDRPDDLGDFTRKDPHK
jgi:hypothetical protein